MNIGLWSIDMNIDLWSILSSRIALGIYAVIVLIEVIVLILMLLESERRYAKRKPGVLQVLANDPVVPPEPEEKKKNKKNKNADEAIAPVSAPAVSEKEEEASAATRFCMLSEIDKQRESRETPQYEKELDLEGLCREFRNFAADKLKLYYDIADIRRFIANMAVSHILIMQGMSGTGKTSMAYAFGEFVRNRSVIIPIQPMWKERTDMIGYYNEFTKRFNETTLLQKMYEAGDSDDVYIVVLDEVNIARVEYYFAEFLSLLELPDPEKRYLDVVSDVWDNDPKLLKNGQLKLPTNMWFVGTANNDDSTFAISDKVYDRAMIMNLDKKTRVFEPEAGRSVKLSAQYFEKLSEKAKKEYGLTKRNQRRLAELDEYLISRFKITFGNRIMKQIHGYIPAYLACGGEELEALDDILSKKVFRKLESQNPIYVRNSVDDLCAYLDELFGYDKMPLCKEYLRKFERSA